MKIQTQESFLNDGFNFDPYAKNSVLDDNGVHQISDAGSVGSSDEETQFQDSKSINTHDDEGIIHVPPIVTTTEEEKEKKGQGDGEITRWRVPDHIFDVNLYPTFKENPFAQGILDNKVLKETNIKKLQSESKGQRQGHDRKTELDLIDKEFPHGTRNGENVETLNLLRYAHVKRAMIVVCHHGTLDEKQNPLTLEDLNKIFSDSEVMDVLGEMNSNSSEVDMQRITCFAMVVKFLHDRIGLKGNGNFGCYLSIAARLESPDPTVQYNTGGVETPPTRLRRRIIYLLTGIGRKKPRGLPVAKISSETPLK